MPTITRAQAPASSRCHAPLLRSSSARPAIAPQTTDGAQKSESNVNEPMPMSEPSRS